MMKTLLLLPLIALFFGCSSHHEPLPTVEKLSLDRYKGTWYEIARYEHRFEKGCRDVSATYSLRDDGKIDVLNRCMKDDGLSEAHGVAYATDASNTKLKVSFFWPFYGDYWVLMLADDYRYALVGDPSREYLWILSRTPTLDPADRELILKNLPALGYQEAPLVWTQQTGAQNVMH
jgi:apolipoprotein D and lipocalin family protein